MIIYKTTNLINGKIYVGKDIKNDPDYLGSGIVLKKSMKKYGKVNFIKEVLETCFTRSELNEQEIFWIKKLRSTDKNIGYNISSGGDGGNIYINLPVETKNKIKYAVAQANTKRLKTFGKNNKIYKGIDIRLEKIIRSLAVCIGREKIYNVLKNFSIVHLSPRTLSRRLNEWKINTKGKNGNLLHFPIDKFTIESSTGVSLSSDTSINILSDLSQKWIFNPYMTKEKALAISKKYLL